MKTRQTRLIVRNDVSNIYTVRCCFCDKIFVSDGRFPCLEGQQTYCVFCFRHGFNFRSNRNVLIMSYRAILAHYYYHGYLGGNVSHSAIRWLIEEQEKVGLRNPVFTYDPETFLWFVDFNRIGNTSKKVPLGRVLEDANLMLKTLDLNEWVPGNPYEKTWKKYEEAIKGYYHKRQRPKNRRMLIPTLCDSADLKPEEAEMTRRFVASDFVMKY